jgi:predicted MFS family arabinose efflux permease
MSLLPRNPDFEARVRGSFARQRAMALIGAAMFSEFFVLTLYLQNVLGYSAVESGAAFTGFAGTVVVVSNLAQPIVARLGVRRSLVLGILLSIASVAALTRLPVDGHYFWDLFPWFVVGGAGVGLTIVPVTIASLQGVDRADAGVASGLVNTSRQIGGAIGIASTSAVIAGAGGLDAGLRNAMYVLLGLLVAAAFLVATAMRPRPAAVQEPVADAVPLQEAA